MNSSHCARVGWVGACVVLLGCGGTGEGTGGTAPEAVPVSASAQSNLSDSELQSLADQYLNLETDKAGIADIKRRIRALSPAQAHKFGEFALGMGNPDPKMRALSESALDYAESKGISFLDLQKTDGRIIMAKFLGVPLESVPLDDSAQDKNPLPSTPSGVGVSREAACGWTEVACSWTSAWNSSVGRTTCAYTGACSPGLGWDRAGNSPCEALACDYRIWFQRASGAWLDGVTTAADCVIDYYTYINKYSTGGYTYVGYGIGGPAYCFFYPANPAAHFNLK